MFNQFKNAGLYTHKVCVSPVWRKRNLIRNRYAIDINNSNSVLSAFKVQTNKSGGFMLGVMYGLAVTIKEFLAFEM